jgi:hypothetical protein
MTLQRAFWGLPLAVAVAVLAHLAVFGLQHAPGGGHSAELLTALAAALGLSLAGAFFAGALGSKRPIATPARLGYSPLALAAAAAVAYGLIELSEGHAAGPWPAAVATMLPLALAVAWLARAAGRAAHGAGLAFATYAAQPRARRPAAFTLCRAGAPARSVSFASGTRRGRAPPHPL